MRFARGRIGKPYFTDLEWNTHRVIGEAEESTMLGMDVIVNLDMQERQTLMLRSGIEVRNVRAVQVQDVRGDGGWCPIETIDIDEGPFDPEEWRTLKSQQNRASTG
jgi:hypothetical protein